ncbi:MarR family winged helix-turn-helix transcriptional regulator [Leucobacter sp. wl10]|uniref:MarR family winged helix-turn-helix transcriptional regulator n=1 Tax=Leucobacter sp. wl10 TaxID=2304677 RepID=UPI001F09952F|nr:MarR family transcriptional regulator [Leucobacter sp. wl10]
MSGEKSLRASETDVLALDLTRASGRFSRIAGRVPGVGYSLVAWRVLAELEQSGSARVSDLAQQQRISQPSMTGLVQRLEGERWVERRADPDDRRASLVSITAAGRSALDDYRRMAAARVSPHLAELTDFDRATLARAVELMQRIGDRIGDPSG